MAMSATRIANRLKNARQNLKNALYQGTTPAQLESALDAYDLAVANAFLAEIKNYATISPLSVSNTPAGDPVHSHSPASTETATAKIS